MVRIVEDNLNCKETPRSAGGSVPDVAGAARFETTSAWVIAKLLIRAGDFDGGYEFARRVFDGGHQRLADVLDCSEGFESAVDATAARRTAGEIERIQGQKRPTRQ